MTQALSHVAGPHSHLRMIISIKLQPACKPNAGPNTCISVVMYKGFWECNPLCLRDRRFESNFERYNWAVISDQNQKSELPDTKCSDINQTVVRCMPTIRMVPTLPCLADTYRCTLLQQIHRKFRTKFAKTRKSGCPGWRWPVCLRKSEFSLFENALASRGKPEISSRTRTAGYS